MHLRIDYICLYLVILNVSYQMLYWLCDLGYTVDDGQLHLLNHYINMQCLPPHYGTFVHTVWLLDNRNYHVSKAQ